MLKNNLKLALRIMTKEKLFSFIKIGGFAIGIAACLLITLFIQDELSYNKHHPEHEQIFRVVSQGKHNGETMKLVYFPPPFAEAVAEDYPEIETAARVLYGKPFAGDMLLQKVDAMEGAVEKGMVYADPELLTILQPEMLTGDLNSALTDPQTLIISERNAKRLFPGGDALGAQVIIDNESESPHTITGIFKRDEKQSHLDVDYFITLSGVELWENEQTSWASSNYPSYVKIAQGVDPAALEEKLLEVNTKYLLPMLLEHMSSEDARSAMEHSKFILQPIGDIHLNSAGIIDNIEHGDYRFVLLFGAIAVFILLLACINFINLSTAKSANRAKEVGLRKTVGAFKSDLIAQFLTESVLYSIIAFALGLLLAYFLLPTFNIIAAKSIIIPWATPWFIPLIMLSSLLIGLLSGLYPSLYLSAFKPVDVLKGRLSAGSKSGRLRSALVVFQFTTSIILIIGTIVVYQQLSFILNKDMGYDRHELMLVKECFVMEDQVHTFKEELKKIPSLKSVTMSSYLPVTGTYRNGNSWWIDGRQKEDKSLTGQIWRVDEDYIDTYEMTVLEGRNFSTEFASDTTAIILNETMVRKLGLNPAVGAKITNGGDVVWNVIGVVKDFHFQPLNDEVGPLSLVLGESRSIFTVRFDQGSLAQARSDVEEVWSRFVPNQSINVSYLNNEFEEMHEDVQRMAFIFNSFALFALLVACLGLFALSAFMVEQRKKEISIRLVLGASFKSIYNLLTWDFLKLVIVSFLIAIPIAWYIMSRWLEDYAYRIDLGWEIFALSGLVAILIALVTISYQAVGAALLKPLDGLRSE